LDCRAISLSCYSDHTAPHSFPTRRSSDLLEPVARDHGRHEGSYGHEHRVDPQDLREQRARAHPPGTSAPLAFRLMVDRPQGETRSEEHTSELQSRVDLVCRLLLEKKKKNE